ncbi:DUF2164 domain-containing protein [Henriciella aquimarina]|uniref:DUF2164 domain-containing protein n=1 Tax=Henriciella aquimarina TaxID=545261 RepID=UPI000A05709A|nr:DUF2164 domain-containing protein [Henriciella aquimarina]
MTSIELSDERRDALIAYLQQLFSNEFDEHLSDFRAGEVLDLMLKTLGPTVYNQAVEDVRAHLQAKLDDLGGEVYVDPDRT